MESLIAEKQSTQVRFEPESGLLAYQELPYELSLIEIRELFVDSAPFRDERQLIFDAFLVYLRQTESIVPDRRVWVDGSFMSVREDRAPSDIDILLIVGDSTPDQRRELARRGLLTMSEVRSKIGTVEIPEFSKLSPYGGLVDAYYVDSSQPSLINTWAQSWSTPKGEDGQLDFSRSKGFVEVIPSD